MIKKDVSCIIPCYNCENHVKKTISSILNQTFTPTEIVLINDASTDNTLEILLQIGKQYTDIIKVISLRENKGVSYTRNLGVMNTKGEYILFMDSDDIAEFTLIENYNNRLRELNSDFEDKYILCYSAHMQIDENDVIISGISKGLQVEPEEILGYKFIRNYISTSGVLIKREKFLEVGGFNLNFSHSEDWDLWLRLATIGGFAYVDQPLVNIRRHGENMSSKVATMLDAERKVLKQYDIEYIKNAVFKRNLGFEENTVDYISLLFRLDNWEDGFLELKKLIEKGNNFYNLYFSLGLYYLKIKDIKSALEYFNKTISIKNDHGAALNNAGALLLLDGDKKNAAKYLDLAIRYFPSYMDANNNYKLLDRESISLEELKFTWRELRKVLTNYNG